MANLPPRPKSPLPTLDVNRDRDRDRVSSALPMASRLRRSPDRERPYVPRQPPRSSDTYIPSYGNRREGDGRRDYDDRERDRDRYREPDRRDRQRRDFSPPRRRRDSPGRSWDCRPPRRFAERRYPSPRRGPYYRRSRSRSPRRGSRSPRKYRSRTRSRSGSPHRSSPKATRSRRSVSRSPYSNRRRSSRSRSHSLGNQPSTRTTNEQDTKDTVSQHSMPPVKMENSPLHLPEQPVVKQEEQEVVLLSHDVPYDPSKRQNVASPRPALNLVVKVESPKVEPTEVHVPFVGVVKPEPALQSMKLGDTEKGGDSPFSPPSPKELRTSVMDDFSSNLSLFAAPQAPRAPRSPPRGPRSYHHSVRGTGVHGQSHLSAQRAMKRRTSNIFVINGKLFLHLHNGEKVELPERPKSDPIIDMEKTLALTRTTGYKLANDVIQQIKGLPRTLHEFQLASLDLRAAEGRRKVVEAHLEKAKNGTLGIDYVQESTETKT